MRRSRTPSSGAAGTTIVASRLAAPLQLPLEPVAEREERIALDRPRALRREVKVGCDGGELLPLPAVGAATAGLEAGGRLGQLQLETVLAQHDREGLADAPAEVVVGQPAPISHPPMLGRGPVRLDTPPRTRS